jgi:hypothetical protein
MVVLFSSQTGGPLGPRLYYETGGRGTARSASRSRPPELLDRRAAGAARFAPAECRQNCEYEHSRLTLDAHRTAA